MHLKIMSYICHFEIESVIFNEWGKTAWPLETSLISLHFIFLFCKIEGWGGFLCNFEILELDTKSFGSCMWLFGNEKYQYK